MGTRTIIPGSNNAGQIGSESKYWNKGYFNTLHANTLVTSQTGLSAQTITVADGGIIFEGSVENTNETYLIATNPTGDRIIQLPDAGGTIALTSDTVTLNGTTANGIATFASSGTLDIEQYVTFENSGNISTLSLLSNQDTGDKFTIETTTHGATTFTTVDDNATAADLIFTPDGDVRFNIKDADADSLFKISTVGGTNHLLEVTGESGNYSRFRMYEGGGDSTDDYFDIHVQEHGETIIYTVDNAAEAADLTFDVDGDITLDADGGTIEFKDDNTSRFRFSLDATPEIDVTGNFTLDCSGTIELNADGNSIMFKDSTTEIMEVTSNSLNLISIQGIKFEGTPDAHETALGFTDPTADRTITLPDATGTVALTSDIPDETVSTGSFISKQVKVTLSQANCNSLHAIPQELIPAQGADTIIVPAGGIMMVDRNSAQNNHLADLNFHYADKEPGTYAQTSLCHIRRFMHGNTTDIVYSLGEISGFEISQNLTDCVNKAVEVSVDSALTSNSMTSITIYLTYHVIDIS